MSIFGQRATPERLATELLRGLESGDVVFDEGANAPAAEQAAVLLADRAAQLIVAKIAPLCAQLQALVDQATVALNQLEAARRLSQDNTPVDYKKE